VGWEVAAVEGEDMDAEDWRNMYEDCWWIAFDFFNFLIFIWVKRQEGIVQYKIERRREEVQRKLEDLWICV
jgi:hypothetical protein